MNLRDAVTEVRAGFPTLTDVQVGLVALSIIDNQPLDIYVADDAAVLLWAERLVVGGLAGPEALAQVAAHSVLDSFLAGHPHQPTQTTADDNEEDR